MRVTTVVDLESGKDLVPIHINDPDKMGVVEVAEKVNEMVQKARAKKD